MDSEGKPMRGENDYVLHFSKEESPPVDAFWSLTMYDEEGYQVANPINRFAIGDRDALKYNADGSVDLFIHHENPGPEKESNWLPSPASDTLSPNMRLYAPRAEVVSGAWAPLAIRCVKAKGRASIAAHITCAADSSADNTKAPALTGAEFYLPIPAFRLLYAGPTELGVLVVGEKSSFRSKCRFAAQSVLGVAANCPSATV